MRFFWMLAFGFVAIGFNTAASAREVKVGDAGILNLAPAPGYCEFNPEKNDFDRAVLTNLAKMDEANGTVLLASFPLCAALDSSRKSKLPLEGRIDVVAETRSIGSSDITKLRQTCSELKTLSLSEQQKREMADNVKKNSGGNRQTDASSIGFLGEVKDDVCYYATINRFKVGKEQKDLAMLYIAGVNLKVKTMIFVQGFSVYVDDSSVQPALARLKTIYADFSKANPK
jgi:hypothetical protein